MVSMEKEADIWDRREQESLELGSIEGQGAAAYAAEQAAIRRGLANDFKVIWRCLPKDSVDGPELEVLSARRCDSEDEQEADEGEESDFE